MPRTVEVSLSPEKADAVLRRLAEVEGVAGLARHRGASLQPPGDVLSIQTSNDAARPVTAILDELGVTADGGSVVTSEPRSLVSPGTQGLINREWNETTWDEMAFLFRQDTNLAPNYVALTALAGAVAAAGLWTDTLHVVIGAMVIAPAFEPLLQISFGLLVGPRRSATSGLISTAAGYLALALGGAVALWILQAIDPSRSSDLGTRRWVRFWSTVTPPGVLTSAFGAAAGAVVVSGQRSVLTTGVMIALALVPSMAVAGMALASGDVALAGRGLVRWAVDAALVVVVGGLVLALKRAYLHRHRALS